MSVISMKQLLEAGVHFGHQTRRWNPKMAPYIYTERNGIYIIDLQKSVGMVDDAYKAVSDIAAEGGTILFVGTKKQAQDAIKAEAERCGMFYVNERWLGGMLTNFKTIQSRVKRLKEIEAMSEDGTFDVLPKKEVIALKKEWAKLEKNLGGIKEMKRLPDAIFVVDPKKERICVQEAHTLGITLIGICDTNCDPEELDYVIPGNDDAIRAVKLIVSKMADAVIEANQGATGEEEYYDEEAVEAAEEAEEAITAGMVKELREMTGAGMMDCKKALTETNGDMDAAVEFLRKNGQAKAEKKAGRIAAEGIVKTVVKDDKIAAIVEVNSETDFVAKNDEFQGFVETVVNQVADTDPADMDTFMAAAWAADPSKTVKDALVEKIAVIGENLNIRRFERVNAENGCVVSYIHGGGRIGVLVVADTDVVNDEIKTCLKNVAMQVAAMSPKYVSRDEVSQDFMDHEKEILLAQAKKENPEKPDNIIEKMIIGRLNKEMKEICLLDQVYVQDSDLTVAKYVDKVAKENNANVKVTKFVRFETGEGIEKKQENFAEEVAKQMAGN